MKEFIAEFRKFVMRGNVVDLAVAVVIGVAFNAVIQSFVNNIINPIIGAIFGKPNFDNLTVKIGHGVIRYGALQTRLSKQTEEEAELSEKDVLLEIRDLIAAQNNA